MKYWATTLAILAALFTSLALADDFKTTDGTEYKNAKVSRVEPDGIVITFSGGIVKIPFTELSPEIQKKYGYNSQAAAAYSVEDREQQAALAQQRQAEAEKRAADKAKYWSEHPMPQLRQQSSRALTGSSLDQPSSASGLHGSSLDRPPYDQAMTALFLVSQYATNQINADRLYKGRRMTIGGTIKSIDSERGETAVELFVPNYIVGKAWFMRCIFNDSRGLEQYQAGSSIGFIGTVAGLSGYTLTVKDCQLTH